MHVTTSEAAMSVSERTAAWSAVMTRDGSRDGSFVYAVRTTGVYCQPSCPARRPRRRNVELFRDAAAAERADYRACLRCKPQQHLDPEVQRAAQVQRYLESHAERRVALAELAEHFGLSSHHLQRSFKRVVGISPAAYGRSLRLLRFEAGLEAPGSVTGAAFDAGYGSLSRAYAAAARGFGMTPGSLKRGGAGAEITYGLANGAVGTLLVARTSRGVCAASLGDDPASLEAALEKRFAHAHLHRDDDALTAELAALGEAAAGRAMPTLSVDLVGTEFQRQVWDELAAIPRGKTLSYAELAARVGRPDAVRAVASACAANPIALLIPCHRVLRGDGGLGGYRWGEWRKRRLLEAESD